MKPKVYLETSVISYLTALPSNDLRAMANQNSTLEWWQTLREKFELLISEFVIAEASMGNADAAQCRLAVAQDLVALEANESVRSLGKALVAHHALPAKAEIDAYHVAIAAVHSAAFLLTWNCTHIANAATRPKIEATCRRLGFEPPIICTPLELMEE